MASSMLHWIMEKGKAGYDNLTPDFACASLIGCGPYSTVTQTLFVCV